MKRILSVLIIMALVLGTMPATYAATPVATTFKAISDLTGAHVISLADPEGKVSGPYFGLLDVNSKGAVTFLRRSEGKILPEKAEGDNPLKLVLSKDKKSISYTMNDVTTVVTKDKKGKLVFNNKFPDDDTVYPLAVRTFKNKDTALASLKADKNLKKMVEDEMNHEGGY